MPLNISKTLIVGKIFKINPNCFFPTEDVYYSEEAGNEITITEVIFMTFY